ncbi:MAG: hypothetical protein HRJ53_00795 [Acidobacteria bacterium Pan2503]|uniref:Uncharacterized protein n=1 Tax=Candidatus Acidiferrum panamense TaxID=2741543 RepID=A0A7V8NLD6_9BACT|nr:hypothetical protein [Candidatus Acidoferrum panamensis]
MNVHMVTVHYDPGRPAHYAVTGSPDNNGAVEIVLHSIGYHPGVRLSCFRCVDLMPIVLPEYQVKYRPLTRWEKVLIRYND